MSFSNHSNKGWCSLDFFMLEKDFMFKQLIHIVLRKRLLFPVTWLLQRWFCIQGQDLVRFSQWVIHLWLGFLLLLVRLQWYGCLGDSLWQIEILLWCAPKLVLETDNSSLWFVGEGSMQRLPCFVWGWGSCSNSRKGWINRRQNDV